MNFRTDREFLEEQTESVLRSLSSDLFLEDMVAFKGVEGLDRLKYATSNMTPNKLVKRGLEMPSGMRVSSRAFEEPGQDKYFDISRGYHIGKKLLETNELARDLRENSPEIYRELRDFIGKYSPDSPFITPIDPDGNPIVLGPNGEPLPIGPDGIPIGPNGLPYIDPRNGASACGCACGGAATVCGGAGGGASS